MARFNRPVERPSGAQETAARAPLTISAAAVPRPSASARFFFLGCEHIFKFRSEHPIVRHCFPIRLDLHICLPSQLFQARPPLGMAADAEFAPFSIKNRP